MCAYYLIKYVFAHHFLMIVVVQVTTKMRYETKIRMQCLVRDDFIYSISYQLSEMSRTM